VSQTTNTDQGSSVATQSRRVILSGALDDISLPTLLQLVQMEALSGWIDVRGRGSIALIKGHVVEARAGKLSGVEGLRELLFGEGGAFVVSRGDPIASDSIECVPFAVMDACRLQDEWARLGGKILRLRGGATWKPTGAPADLVLSTLDGVRSLAELIQASGAPATLVLDAIIDAMEVGLLEQIGAKVLPIRQREPDPEPLWPTPPLAAPPLTPPPLAPPTVTSAAPAPPPTPEAAWDEDIDPNEDLEALLSRARKHLKERDFTAAEALFLRALARSPGDRVIQQNLRRIAHLRGGAA
jgi:hypothetical protein